MSGKKSSVARRILERAHRLFYEQGYAHTGINQIIAEAGVARASFYHHFPSKEELARVYLHEYEQEAMTSFRRLMARSRDINDFFGRWTALLRRSAARRQSEFRGCAVANFIAEGGTERSRFLEESRRIISAWESLFRDYLEGARGRGELKASIDPMRTARRILAIYEGNLALWNMTGDSSYLSAIEDELRHAVGLD